jgi:acyl-coenzyme A synthetase/AMP-(fatty) acid ligase
LLCLLTSLLSCSSRIVITASAVNRATKRVDLKAIVDDAIGKAAKEGYRDVQKVLVYEKSALPRCGTALE